MLSRCFLDFSVSVRASVIGLSQISSFSLVDFQKAYDSVWRDGLMFKLAQCGINGHFLKSVNSMYKSSECCVRVGDQITVFFENNIGVKQVEVLSP